MKDVMKKVSRDIDYAYLMSEYNNFFVPSFNVKIAMAAGAAADKDILQLNPPVAVFNLSINRAIDEAGSFSFTVDNPFSIDRNARKFPRLEKDTPFQPGRNIVVELGYASNRKPVITGTIDSLEVSFDENGLSQLTVKGFDHIQPLMKDKRIVPSTWGKPEQRVKYSDIVKKIAEKYNLKAEIEDTIETFSSVKSQEANDFQFIKSKLAASVGFEVYVRDNVLHFHRPKMDSAPVIKSLEWGKSLISFSPRLELSDQVTSVEVKGWNPDTQASIIGTAGAGSEKNRKQGQSGSEAIKATGSSAMEHIWRPELKTQEQVDIYAKAVLERRSQKLLTGNGECLGLPEIEPGLRIELKGMGERFSTQYYITKVSHSISSSGFKTQFTVTENTLPQKQKL